MRTLWSDASSIRRILKVVSVGAAIVVAFAAAPSVRAQGSTAADEAKSRALVNSARSAVGVSALGDDSRLDTMARAQATRMAQRNAIYHNPNLKSDADAAGVNWRWIGENVGVGPDVQAVHDGFMASPGHHENIVYRDYNAIGVGVAVGGDGSVFVAQVFADVMPAAPAASPSVSPPSRNLDSLSGQHAPVRPVIAAAARRAPASTTVKAASIERGVPQVNALVGGTVNGEVTFGR